MSRGIRLMIVDDLKFIRQGTIALLKSEAPDIEVVGEAETGEDAVRLARECQPDVVLMDLQMPGMGGMEATRKLIRINPEMKILALTVCQSYIFPTRLLEEGASGYVTKDCDIKEVVRAIREVFAGKRYISPSIAQNLALKRYAGKDTTPFDSLSERELQVMIMITKGEKPQLIADTLHLSPKTVNTYRYRLFEKLGVKSDVELTLLALRQGIVEGS